MCRNFSIIFVALTSCFIQVECVYAALSSRDIHTIGLLIWNNEANRRVDQLVFWSEHEPFPSLGIGHAIWYPAGKTFPYTEMFPSLCAYLQRHGKQLPQWLIEALKTGAPWQDRDEFLRDQVRVGQLRELLAATIDLQTSFMVKRLDEQWPQIRKTAPADKQKQITRAYTYLRASLLGSYALIDYLNFKGDGLNPHEQKNGQGWGLLQVLLAMPNTVTQDNAPTAFALAAAQMLLRLIENSAPSYKPMRFFNAWMRRVGSYATPATVEKLLSKRIERKFYYATRSSNSSGRYSKCIVS